MSSSKNTLVLLISTIIIIPQCVHAQKKIWVGAGLKGDLYSYYHSSPAPFPSLTLDFGYSINQKNAVFGLITYAFLFPDFNTSKGVGLRYERQILTRQRSSRSRWNFNTNLESRMLFGKFVYNTLSLNYEVPLYNEKAVIMTIGLAAEKHFNKKNSIIFNVGCGYFHSFQHESPDKSIDNSAYIMDSDKNKRFLLNFTITYRKTINL